MKKIIIALVLGLLLVAGLSAAEVKTVIKFASVAPEGSTWMNTMEDFNTELKEKTSGAVEFRFYSGGVSGDETDVLKKMKINQLQAAGFTSQGMGEVVKEVRMLNLPMIFKNYKDIDYVMEKMSPFFDKEFEKKGLVILGWPEVGFAYVFSKKKIESLKDFQSIKMWIWGNDALVGTMFKNLAITPIPLSLVDVMQSLQTGLIEGVYGSPLSAIALQWNTKVKYMLDMKIANVPGGILINKKAFDKLTPEQQKLIKTLSKKYFTKLTQLSRKENDDALAVIQKQGMIFTTISTAEDKKFFEDVSVKTAKDLVGKFYTQAQLDEMLGYLKSAKK